MAVKLPSPDNFLMCREARQITHFRLMRTEQTLMTALGVANAADLDLAILRDDGSNAALISKYNSLNREMADVDNLFDAACDIQRIRIQHEK